jgi:hypothetical protein
MAAGKILTIVLGAAAIVAVAGGGAYYFLDRVSGEPVKIVELINKPYTLAQTADVLDQPKSEGRFLIRIRQGGSVTVLGVVDGGAWLQIALPKDQEGYIPSVTIPEISSDGTPKPPPAPAVPAVSAAPVAAAAPPPLTPPAATVASAAPPPAADDGPEAPLPPDLIDFQSVDQQVSVAQPTGLYLAPNEHAPQAMVVKPETKVEIIAISKDGKWGWVNVSDGTPAYIKLADLSNPPAPAPQQ